MEAIEALGIAPEGDAANVFAVVISHDCDLAAPSNKEPTVEIIVGRSTGAADGNFVHGRNPRRLHCSCSAGETPLTLDLEFIGRKIVCKETINGRSGLCAYAPRADAFLTGPEKAILQSWLAARYRRAALPNAFNDAATSRELFEKMTRILRTGGQEIRVIFLELDQGEEREHQNEDDPFELRIFLVYSTDADPDQALQAAEQVKLQLEEVFRAQCMVDVLGTMQWKSIELVDIVVRSDEELTYADSLRLTKWHAEHISTATPGHTTPDVAA